MKELITIELHKRRYTVCEIKLNNKTLPIVLDRNVYKVINKLNKQWNINEKNHVYCNHINSNGETHQVYLHEIVVKINKDTDYGRYKNVPIIHINNIHFDNRIENLQFDIPGKDYSKNNKKKKRTIDLSEHGINVDDLPTYIFYVKPDRTHGDRFSVELPELSIWRTTASKRVSLRYKLEEAKKYIRYIKKIKPDIFDSYSMNGDMTSTGIKLYKEFSVIIKKAGFIMGELDTNKTDKFLAPDSSDLTDFETYLLYAFDPSDGYIDIDKSLSMYNSSII